MLDYMEARPIKMVSSPEQATLVTHSGTFHADEVLATAILSYAVPGTGPLTVFRTTSNAHLIAPPFSFLS